MQIWKDCSSTRILLENLEGWGDEYEINKERSDEKVTATRLAIRKLMENGEQISVPQLMKMTGLSRGFFYKNPIIRAEIDQAASQVGMANPRKHILDKAMDDRIGLLMQELAMLKRENDTLKQENEKLKKALAKISRNIISSL